MSGEGQDLTQADQGRMSETTAARFDQLDDMPFETIEAWLLVRGFVVVGRDWHRRMVLPFDGEADRRE